MKMTVPVVVRTEVEREIDITPEMIAQHFAVDEIVEMLCKSDAAFGDWEFVLKATRGLPENYIDELEYDFESVVNTAPEELEFLRPFAK